MSEAVKKPAPLNQDLCSIYFDDPVPAFLEQARQLMFRTALNNDQHKRLAKGPIKPDPHHWSACHRLKSQMLLNADILSDGHSNAEVEELVKEMGSRAVMYGITQASTSGYAQGDYEQDKDRGYVQVRSVNEGQELRLEMADPSKVQALVVR
ncbi:hypothetical protein CERZMDRAFT_94174 [Cercospora zeae-maydis SCOH1-5]|uniref:Uncharacterized protein n=1 Tax=Cercospora zeae-maydis SCOH1-5 TaxID=717836 RepID=A0A6A6FQU5_9PEZI|nr:hypothetical protein CERZMDRAFT_94174 [Cercospora zeae-maydis SCOH1-5]